MRGAWRRLETIQSVVRTRELVDTGKVTLHLESHLHALQRRMFSPSVWLLELEWPPQCPKTLSVQSLTLLDPVSMDTIKLSRIDSTRLGNLKGWFYCIGKFSQLCNLIQIKFFFSYMFFSFLFLVAMSYSSNSSYTMLNNCVDIGHFVFFLTFNVPRISSLNIMLAFCLKNAFPVEFKCIYWIIAY